ncbi:MAG: hypothetical protein QW815_08750, partial [Nitrososphaerota archaeon]
MPKKGWSPKQKPGYKKVKVEATRKGKRYQTTVYQRALEAAARARMGFPSRTKALTQPQDIAEFFVQNPELIKYVLFQQPTAVVLQPQWLPFAGGAIDAIKRALGVSPRIRALLWYNDNIVVVTREGPLFALGLHHEKCFLLLGHEPFWDGILRALAQGGPMWVPSEFAARFADLFLVPIHEMLHASEVGMGRS